MPSTQPSDLNPQVSLNSPKLIWIVNPFDQLPSETDVPLRYWALCKILAEQGHEVIWWSSDFSHLTKSKRAPCPDTDGFSVRLIETPPYTKNISIARLKNHKAFADGFYHDAMVGLKSGELKAPDRIVVSLPPLGIAEQAFAIRNALRKCESKKVGKYEGQYQGRSRVASAPDSNEEKDTANRALKQPCYPDQSSVISHRSCQVIIDIMDAWPETFYQALPKPLRKILGPILLAPLHRSAKRAYCGADKISAVGQSYLDLASRYLGKKWKVEKSESGKGENQRSDQSSTISHQSSPAKPMVLCYHGTDLDRFAQNKGGTPSVSSGMLSPNQQQATNTPAPLRAVYLGSMGSGYDLETIIEVAARWKAEGDFPFQIHFAGDGPQREALEARATQLGLTSTQSSVINHQSSIIKATFKARELRSHRLSRLLTKRCDHRPATLSRSRTRAQPPRQSSRLPLQSRRIRRRRPPDGLMSRRRARRPAQAVERRVRIQ